MTEENSNIRIAKKLGKFIDESPTPYHAVENMSWCLFNDVGFHELYRRESWNLLPGEKYYIQEGGSLVAFIVGKHPPEMGCRLVVAHTDSPNWRIKPVPVSDRSGYICLNVEPYGSVLNASWLDRDLSIAGVVSWGHNAGPIAVTTWPMKIDEPIARISQLAIHLNREANDKGLVFNPQSQSLAVVGLTENGVVSQERFEEFFTRPLGSTTDGYFILSTDLSLYDTQKSAIGGLNGEFLYASRLDNLASCWTAAEALASVSSAEFTCMVACFNHEEVGSESAEGAVSPMLGDVLERIALSQGGGREEYLRMCSNSICLSSDMSHALNPNFPEKHDSLHAPVLNQGIAVKINRNQRYATTAVTEAFFALLCRDADVKHQRFVNRADIACGSTIGPMISSRYGIPTVDVGPGLLSMHSIRECAGTKDIEDMVKLFTFFFGR